MPVHSTTIFTLAYLLPPSLAHLPQQKKHYLNMLSSKTNALLTHTLASFWRKQSCIDIVWHLRRLDFQEFLRTPMTGHDGNSLISGHYGNMCYWVSHGHLSDKWCPCLIPFSIVSVIDLYCPWQMCHNEPMSFAHWHINELISPGINPCDAEFSLRSRNIFVYSLIYQNSNSTCL